MNEKKIRDAIDRVEPSEDTKERMYRNILKKAAQPTASERQPISLAKYLLPIAACLCLIVFGITRFLPNRVPNIPDESGVQRGNPFVEAENADEFHKLGITLDAPSSAENVSYAVIDGEIAQVGFQMNGFCFLARASVQSEDFYGIYGKELSAEPIDEENNAVLVTVQTDFSSYEMIRWSHGKVKYCLYSTDGANRESVRAIYNAMN